DGEWLVVGPGSIPQHAKCNGLAEQQRSICIAAPVDARVDPVAETHVVAQLVQLAVDGELACVRASVRNQRQSIGRGHDRIGYDEVSIEKELEDGDASAAHGAVPCWIGWMHG